MAPRRLPGQTPEASQKPKAPKQAGSKTKAWPSTKTLLTHLPRHPARKILSKNACLNCQFFNYNCQMLRLSQKNTHAFLLILISALAIFFRTYNYHDRIRVTADNGRDAQVAAYAAKNRVLPAAGQFSSAGPFFYGPIWYWVLTVVAVIPLGPLGLWYFATALSLLFIILIYYLGKQLAGPLLGIIAAAYAAVSPAQIENSFTVWNPSIVPFLSLLSVIFLLKFYKKPTAFFAFLTALTVGTAISVHFQSILLLPTILVALGIVLKTTKPKAQLFKNLISLFAGFIIPFIPIIVFDINHNWYDTTNLIVYLAVDQYKIYVPNRWLTYAFSYWPQTWGYIIGGSKLAAAFLMTSIAALTIATFKNAGKNALYFILLATFVLEIIMFRYYRGERHFYYSLFAHPAVIILTAWLTINFIKFKKIIGFTAFGVVIASTLPATFKILHTDSISYTEITAAKSQIYSSFPHHKFDIWKCIQLGTSIGHPISYFIYQDGRESRGEDEKTLEIGVCEYPNNRTYWKVIDKKQAIIDKWINVSTEQVHRETALWWIDKPPKKGSGNLLQFLLQNAFSK